VTTILEVDEVTKSFGHVQALRGTSLTIRAGEVLGLVGDNGAGKSTLMKVLAGWHRADDGRIRVDGQTVDVSSTSAARRLGIETLYQDLAMAPDLDIVENMFLGREDVGSGVRRALGIVRRKAMREETERILDEMDVRLPSITVPVGQLSGGQRQVIAVARALAWARRVVLMDEPTAALGVRQTEQVLRSVRAAADRGLAAVVISHNLPELLELADRVVVMRLGRDVADLAAEQADTPTLVAAMAGLTTPGGGADERAS
jgi:simple sugar transport system ATP-binding protein